MATQYAGYAESAVWFPLCSRGPLFAAGSGNRLSFSFLLYGTVKSLIVVNPGNPTLCVPTQAGKALFGAALELDSESLHLELCRLTQ